MPEVQLLQRQPLYLRPQDEPLRGFAAFLLMDNMKKSTIYRHVTNARRILRDISSFTPQGIDEFYAQQKEKGVKNTYLNSLTCTLRRYGQFKQIEWLQHWRFLKKEVFQKTTMSDEEIEAFLELPPEKVKRRNWKSGVEFYCPANPKLHEAFTMFFCIAAFTGMRPGEIAHLTVNDIDWGRGVFVIVDSKTNQPGVAPIPPNIKDRLERYIKSLPIGQKYLFLSTYGGRTKRSNGDIKVFNNTSWHYQFHKRLQRLGISRTNLTPYSFRHSFATRLLESDVSLFHIKKLMRHNDLKSTLVYEHLTTKDLIAAVKKLPMVRFGSDPRGILQDIAQAFKNFELQNDPRFQFSIQECGDTVEIKISIKKGDSDITID